MNGDNHHSNGGTALSSSSGEGSSSSSAAAAAAAYRECARSRRGRVERAARILLLSSSSSSSRATSAAAASASRGSDDGDVVDTVDNVEVGRRGRCSLRGLYESERSALRENNNACRRCCSTSTITSTSSSSNNNGGGGVLPPFSCIRLLLPTAEISDDQSDLLKRYVSDNTFQGVQPKKGRGYGSGSRGGIVLVLVGAGEDDDGDGVDSNGGGENRRKQGVEDCYYDGEEEEGIRSNRIGDGVVLHARSSVRNNGWLADCYVGKRAVLRNCGRVSTDDDEAPSMPSPSFRLQLRVGPESGGERKLSVDTETDMIEVCRQLVGDGSSSEDDDDDDDDAKPSTPAINIFCENSYVRDTPTINNVFVYPGASIVAATSVEDAVLYPSAVIRNSCTVKRCRMQWKTSISGNSAVTGALLMEESHVGPQSVVAESVLGPDVHVSCGEVHASVLGPNTNAHHQSLLISVLWPLGRGNVGYGANVGSNHTGRLPDQETVAGEGTFWGLGTVVKFPVSLAEAPYTVVAAGTVLPPQRLRMPFSLVLTSSKNGGRNSLLPGWVLRSSPYTIARSEAKFAKRRKAKRHGHYTGWKIIRPDTIKLCVWARDSLRKKAQSSSSPSPVPTSYFGEKQICGIGPNELTEKGRKDGIQAYTDCIQRFALTGLLAFLTDNTVRSSNWKAELQGLLDRSYSEERSTTIREDFRCEKVEWNAFPWQSDESKLWEYQKSLLTKEFPPSVSSSGASSAADVFAWVSSLLERLVALELEHARQVHQSKHRDDTRGEQTIPGYADSHVAAEDDPVVVQVRAAAAETERSVSDVLAQLDQSYSYCPSRATSKL